MASSAAYRILKWLEGIEMSAGPLVICPSSPESPLSHYKLPSHEFQKRLTFVKRVYLILFLDNPIPSAYNLYMLVSALAFA